MRWVREKLQSKLQLPWLDQADPCCDVSPYIDVPLVMTDRCLSAPCCRVTVPGRTFPIFYANPSHSFVRWLDQHCHLTEIHNIKTDYLYTTIKSNYSLTYSSRGKPRIIDACMKHQFMQALMKININWNTDCLLGPNFEKFPQKHLN